MGVKFRQAEHRSPKPDDAGSLPATPATIPRCTKARTTITSSRCGADRPNSARPQSDSMARECALARGLWYGIAADTLGMPRLVRTRRHSHRAAARVLRRRRHDAYEGECLRW